MVCGLYCCEGDEALGLLAGAYVSSGSFLRLVFWESWVLDCVYAMVISFLFVDEYSISNPKPGNCDNRGLIPSTLNPSPKSGDCDDQGRIP